MQVKLTGVEGDKEELEYRNEVRICRENPFHRIHPASEYRQ